MLDAYIYDGLRSPFGRHGGMLAPVRPDDMAAEVIRAVVERSPFSPEQYEDVILGCTNQAGEDSRNVGRHAALLSGFPQEVAGRTVNRLCASGLQAVVDAARAVTCGEGELFVAGGVESMSRAPFVMGKSEKAYGRDVRVFDSTIGARSPTPSSRRTSAILPSNNLTPPCEVRTASTTLRRSRLACATVCPSSRHCVRVRGTA